MSTATRSTDVERTRVRFFPQLDVRLHPADAREARAVVEDESVDLLQMGGYPSYEVAKEEYERWLAELAPDGVVLISGVAPWQRSGSAQLWRDLSVEHNSLTFVHSSGLGVLFPKRTDRFEYLLGDEFTRWKEYYAARDTVFFGDSQLRDQRTSIQERDTRITELEHESAALRGEVDGARRRLGDERSAATAAAPTEAPADAAEPPKRGFLRRIVRLLRRGARSRIAISAPT